jgi:hypothetical protein
MNIRTVKQRSDLASINYLSNTLMPNTHVPYIYMYTYMINTIYI